MGRISPSTFQSQAILFVDLKENN